MDEKKTTPDALKHELSFDEKVLKKIASIATDDVQGVLTVSDGLIDNISSRLRSDDRTKGIAVDVGTKQVALDLNVVCEYGRHIPMLFDEVVGRVSKAILEMTGLEVVELNMHVDDVLSRANFEDMRQKQASKNYENDNAHTYSTQTASSSSRVQ